MSAAGLALTGCIYVEVVDGSSGAELGEESGESETDGSSSNSGASASGGSASGSGGATDASIDCAQMPKTALGASYAYVPETSGELSGWSAQGLPPGLSIHPATGEVAGVVDGPSEVEYADIRLAAFDVDGESIEAECGPVFVEPKFELALDELGPAGCLPYTAAAEELYALLDGGDGSLPSCKAPTSGVGNCPLGDGMGELPPGIDYAPETCSHSGEISEDIRGTWVWMIAVEQSGVEVRVPICATRDYDAHHEITTTVLGTQLDDLEPWTLEHDPTQAPALLDGDATLELLDPSCVDDPSNCSYWGFGWSWTCSPTLGPELVGVKLVDRVRYSLLSAGTVPESPHDAAPAVTSIEIWTCTSADASECEGGVVEDNAQTRYHLSVITQPVD